MRIVFLAMLLVAGTAHGQGVEFPKEELRVDGASLTVYLPDAAKGYYRGSRFEWGGVIENLKFQGRTIFGPWKPKHDPTNNDDITGPCQEFGMQEPLGYATAKADETFLKLGVGELVKPDDEPYKFFRNYKNVNPGRWRVSKGVGLAGEQASIVFRQTVQTKLGYSYHFVKTITLSGGGDGKRVFLDLRNELINTGEKTIRTNLYNHNFFNVDATPIGPRYKVIFEHELKADAEAKFGPKVKLEGKQFTYTAPLAAGESASGLLLNAKDQKPADYYFEMQYMGEKPGEGVRIQVNGQLQQTVKFQLWSIGTTLCPEPFTELVIEPGEAVSWLTTYALRGGE